MSIDVLKILVTLGVPGVALYVMFLLFSKLGFKFAQIGPVPAAIIAILFLLIVGFITYTALTKYAVPSENDKSGVRHLGMLSTLQDHLLQSKSSDLNLTLPDEKADPEHVRELYVKDTQATSWRLLLKKICEEYKKCIKCEFSDKAVSISSAKAGSIERVQDDDGSFVYGCHG